MMCTGDETAPSATGWWRIRRLRGLCALAWTRVRTRGLETAPGRTWLGILGVAFAVALVVLTTALALGLAAPIAGAGDANQYWLVPDSGGPSSPLVSSAEPQFSRAHRATDRIAATEGVESATPLLITVVPVATAHGPSEYVVVVGVIPSENAGEVLGLSTTEMTAGSPYYADGSYDGEWTGDAVLSDGAAELLEADSGTKLTLGTSDRSLTVRAVDSGGDAFGPTPIVVVHLAELQSITGADEHDQADQFLIRGEPDAAALEERYPQATVLSGSELTAQRARNSELSLALALSAGVVSLVVGTLFVTTTMALEAAADRRTMTTLAALGISDRSRATLYGIQLLVLAAIGGVIGTAIGLLGVSVINLVAEHALAAPPVAQRQPWLISYGLATALLIGLLSVPALWTVMRWIDDGGERHRA